MVKSVKDIPHPSTTPCGPAIMALSSTAVPAAFKAFGALVIIRNAVPLAVGGIGTVFLSGTPTKVMLSP